jgi:5-methylcytosine-specific restriction endonuclease McrA
MPGVIECSVCGQPRRDMGKCKSCGTGLCVSCKIVLPRDRKSPTCPPCAREQSRKAREANPEKHIESCRKYRAANPEKRRESCRKWHAANKVKNRALSRKWREANPGKAKQTDRKWRDAHPEQRREVERNWRETHREENREKDRRRRARKAGCSVSATDIRQVVAASNGICALCWAYVPDGMRHIDHIIPLDKGGPHSSENLQLLCYRCNTRKGAKLPGELVMEKWIESPSSSQPFLLNPDWK